MPLTPTQRDAIGARDTGGQFTDQFTQFPHDLVGMVDSVTVAPDQAVMNLVMKKETIEITLYSDDEHPGSLTPRDGMWRGAILGLAQRALTQQHQVTVATLERRTSTIHVWVALALTVHKGTG